MYTKTCFLQLLDLSLLVCFSSFTYNTSGDTLALFDEDVHTAWCPSILTNMKALLTELNFGIRSFANIRRVKNSKKGPGPESILRIHPTVHQDVVSLRVAPLRLMICGKNIPSRKGSRCQDFFLRKGVSQKNKTPRPLPNPNLPSPTLPRSALRAPLSPPPPSSSSSSPKCRKHRKVIHPAHPVRPQMHSTCFPRQAHNPKRAWTRAPDTDTRSPWDLIRDTLLGFCRVW